MIVVGSFQPKIFSSISRMACPTVCSFFPPTENVEVWLALKREEKKNPPVRWWLVVGKVKMDTAQPQLGRPVCL